MVTCSDFALAVLSAWNNFPPDSCIANFLCHLTPVAPSHEPVTLKSQTLFFLFNFHLSTYHYVAQYILFIFLLYCLSSL